MRERISTFTYAHGHGDTGVHIECVYVAFALQMLSVCVCNASIYANRKISIIYFVAAAAAAVPQIMHLFVALILTNDDSTVLSASNAPSSTTESHANQSTSKSPSSRKFNLHTFLKEKLLEPNILKIYGKYKESIGMFISALTCLLACSVSRSLVTILFLAGSAIGSGQRVKYTSQRISFALKEHQVQSNAQIKEVFRSLIFH